MNTNPVFKGLQAIFLALLITQIALLFVAHTVEALSPELNDIFGYIVPVVAVAAVAISLLVPARLLAAQLNDPQKDLPQKLTAYQGIKIIRWAPIEGANILALLAFMMTHNATYLYISASLFVFFIYAYPSKRKCIQELQLNEKEQQLLG